MKTSFYLILISLFISCCTTTKENKIIPKVQPNSNLQDNANELTRITDSTTIIKLEVGSNGEVLYSIDDILFYGNDLLVVDKVGSQIIKYDSCGNYIFSIRNKGRGRGEYVALSSAVLINSTIYISDSGTQNVLKYSADDGRFIDSFRAAKMTIGFMSSYNDNIILSSDNVSQLSDYNITVYDTLGVIQNEYLPIIDEPIILQAYFYKYDNELFLMSLFCNYIYQMNEANMDKILDLDYGKSAIPTSMYQEAADKKGTQGEGEILMSMYQNSYSYALGEFSVISDYIFISSKKGDKLILSVINRASNKTTNMDWEFLPHEYTNIIASKNNIGYSAIVYGSVVDALEAGNVPKTTIEPSIIRDYFADAENNPTSPLLVKIYFKQESN